MLYFYPYKAIKREGKVILTSLKNLLPFLIIIVVLLNCNNLNSRSSFADNQTISKINSSSSSSLSSTESKDVSIKKMEYTNENEKSFNSIQSFFQIKLDNIIFPIKFSSLEKNEINNIIYDKDKASIIIILKPSTINTSKLLIQIPRFILDSRTLEKKDKNFMVLIDDKPAKFLEIKQETQNSRNFSQGNGYSNNSSSRELLIDFGKDVKVIKIIGTDAGESQNIQTQNNIYKEAFPVLLKNKTGYLYYNIEGGEIRGGELTKNMTGIKNLSLTITPSSKDGKLLIQIPRFILDSRTLEKKDKNFMVLIDDKPAKFLEIKQETQNSRNFSQGNGYSNNSSSRELLIDFGKDVKVIKIIGTDAGESQNIQTQNHGEKFNLLIPIFSSLSGIALAILYLIYRKGRFKFGFLYKINQKEKNRNKT